MNKKFRIETPTRNVFRLYSSEPKLLIFCHTHSEMYQKPKKYMRENLREWKRIEIWTEKK